MLLGTVNMLSPSRLNVGSPTPNDIDFDIFWTDPYSIIQGTLSGQILMVFVLTAILVSGTMLHLGIMFYEKFGEDPQKRSLLNQVSHKLVSFSYHDYRHSNELVSF